MTIDLDLNGSRRQVTLRRDDDRWIVSLDGRELVVSIADAGGRRSLLIGPPSGAGLPAHSWSSHEVAVEEGAGGALVVHVDAYAVPIVVEPAWRPRRRSRGATGSGDGEYAVVSPMPGRIVRVLVSPGQTVEARQALVVVEAMKMENELRAPRAGTIAEVRVAEGASVEANAVLVVLR